MALLILVVVLVAYAIMVSRELGSLRPLHCHDLVIRHTISAFISRPLADVTISHNFQQNFLRHAKSPWFKARNVLYYVSRDHLINIAVRSCIFDLRFWLCYECQTLTPEGGDLRRGIGWNPTNGIISNVYCLISVAVRSLVRCIIWRICAEHDRTLTESTAGYWLLKPWKVI